jgi:membrane-bound lytic murein transglycosylase F
VTKRGKLHVITRNAPAIYYEGREGLLGLEYELAQLFAQDLGVELDLKVASTRGQILSALDNNYTNLAAAFMVSSEGRSERYQYSVPYMSTAPLVVYRYGSPRPRKIEDLMGKRIAVVSDSYHSEELATLAENHPELTWQKLNIETIDLMKMVQDKSIDFAIVTSAELDIHQSFYPIVKEAFALGAPQNISWYFPRNTDLSLISRANNFFNRIAEDGTLMYLKERYFGHLKQLNYVGARTFIKHANGRLPQYTKSFKKFSEQYGVDWRLMAALGYQESHWRARAVSPTGVRGLMMLTQPTAKEMGISNRLHPIESIKGGVKYFAKTKKRIPDRIPEPDRTWLALAAYNVGFGHMEDARILCEKADKNPDKWADVKECLPWLEKKQYYAKTKHGYARGKEPVSYVQNIRRYYDVLNWLTEQNEGTANPVRQNFAENLLRIGNASTEG